MEWPKHTVPPSPQLFSPKRSIFSPDARRAPAQPLVIDPEDEVSPSPFSASQAGSKPFTWKMINDPIHGHFLMDRRVTSFVDTPEFQRLRDLKQLGSCYMVFPGASHNRFEHSLGVAHLANSFLEELQTRQPGLDIRESESLMVQVAGLCHDLGHGPFSHVFDNEFMPKARPDRPWKHEEGSVVMLDHLIDSAHIDTFDSSEVKTIKKMISGDASGSGDRQFLYRIVSNSRNSIDVDKFDYIARDCYNLDIRSNWDCARLLKTSRVIDNEICFHAKEAFNLYQLFHTRYLLHKTVYTHRVGKAIEYMITDALLEADPVLKISDMVDDPSRFRGLSDCILTQISNSSDPALAKSQEIIENLQRRRLYKFVDEIPVHRSIPKDEFEKVTEQDIVSCQPGGCSLRAEDVILHKLKIDYAMKERNPVDSVLFFNDWGPEAQSFTIPKERVGLIIPDVFLERYFRLFCRNKDKLQEAQAAFTAWVKRNRHFEDASKPKRARSEEPSHEEEGEGSMKRGKM